MLFNILKPRISTVAIIVLYFFAIYILPNFFGLINPTGALFDLNFYILTIMSPVRVFDNPLWPIHLTAVYLTASFISFLIANQKSKKDGK